MRSVDVGREVDLRMDSGGQDGAFEVMLGI